MKYVIKDAKCSITDMGGSCGPSFGVASTIEFNDGTSSKWLSVIEVFGIPAYYLTDRDIHEQLVDNDDSEEFWDVLNESFISEFNDIVLGEYQDTVESFMNAEENDVTLIRTLLWVQICDSKELDKIIKYLIGKSTDEIEVPVLDIEEG